MSDPIPDDLAGLLGPPAPAPADDALRQAVFRQSARVLRRRRRLRWGSAAGLLAACYGAGLLTMALFRPPPAVVTVEMSVPVVPVPPVPENLPPSPIDESGEVLERLAGQATEPHERFRWFRTAGRRYEDQGDDGAALRCYGQALNVATSEDLQVSANTSFLWTILVQDHQEKNDHGKNGG